MRNFKGDHSFFFFTSNLIDARILLLIEILFLPISLGLILEKIVSLKCNEYIFL